MMCWEGDHITLLVVAIIFVLFYALVMPASIAYALFTIGRNGERLNSMQFQARYGFLYLRYVLFLIS